MLDQLVHFVLYCLVAGAIIGLLLYAVAISPVPEPFKGWLRFAVIIIAIFVIIFLLLGLVGGGGIGSRIHIGGTQIGQMADGGISYLPKWRAVSFW
jgi:hypothetical protein